MTETAESPPVYESAQVFKGLDVPTYTKLLFDKAMRLTVAIPLWGGGITTLSLSALLLETGYSRTVFVYGLIITLVATGLGALVPRHRPTLRFRLSCWWEALRPQLVSTADDRPLAPPDIVGNLTFGPNGVHAHYVISGLPYYLQPIKRRVAVADSHQSLPRELPAGTWAFGLSVPQDQRQLLRAMQRGHRHRQEWMASCERMKPIIAKIKPRTRIYWLAFPVDAGRAGHGTVKLLVGLVIRVYRSRVVRRF
jgi:hypothetical protein